MPHGYGLEHTPGVPRHYIQDCRPSGFFRSIGPLSVGIQHRNNRATNFDRQGYGMTEAVTRGKWR